MSSTVPETELQEQLLRDNPEYRRLAEEHQSYDVQLENLSNKHYLNEEEQIQEKISESKNRRIPTVNLLLIFAVVILAIVVLEYFI